MEQLEGSRWLPSMYAAIALLVGIFRPITATTVGVIFLIWAVFAPRTNRPLLIQLGALGAVVGVVSLYVRSVS